MEFQCNLKVTVECKDRGEILAKLRERYASLLSRVPREIKRYILLFNITLPNSEKYGKLLPCWSNKTNIKTKIN